MAIASSSSQGGGGSKKAKIVVKQDMINFIKSQGMSAALKRAGEINAKGTKGEAEFLEGVKRMYGAGRLDAATKAAGGAKPKSYGANNTPAYRPATAKSSNFDARKAASASARGANPKASLEAGRARAPKTGTVKKSQTTDPFARAVFGAGAAVKRVINSSPGANIRLPKPKKSASSPAPKYNRYTQKKVK